MSIVNTLPMRLYADPTCVVIRHFQLAAEPRSLNPVVRSRVERVIDSIQEMDARTAQSELAFVMTDFENRHRRTNEFFELRYKNIANYLKLEHDFSDTKRLLIGAYFCNEYSYQAAALMNPSVVLHPNQKNLDKGSIRFLMSLRSVGEGHISSITFREGILSSEGQMTLDEKSSFSVAAEPEFDENGHVTLVCDAKDCPTESVLFPVTDAQRNGLEDLRLVQFTEDNGESTYYGTYTAYSGSAISSEMLITKNFKRFDMRSMTGSATVNKGMALFPRKINGKYMMIGRQDSENLFVLSSDTFLNWENGVKFAGPKYPWELMQIGNCGSPIELDEGWLMLTHGVGPVRKYSIGAMLLDKNDPTRILGRSVVPLLSPSDAEREGYVPNVVYSCGAITHAGKLFLPYGIADSSVGFATIELSELINSLT